MPDPIAEPDPEFPRVTKGTASDSVCIKLYAVARVEFISQSDARILLSRLTAALEEIANAR